jgi:shikimate kinase
MAPPVKPKHKCALLDPNHSHFILVDDCKHEFGGEVAFRADLESGLSKKFACSSVVIVVGGGPRTARFVFESVEENTPCVFLEVNFDSIFHYFKSLISKRIILS